MVSNPLEELTLGDLRMRTSMKWRAYPADVLPLWVAEMDVNLAEPVQRAIIDAVKKGDTGYAFGYGYAEAPKAKVKASNELIHAYLRGRANLARVYVLVDSRHGLKSADAEALARFAADRWGWDGLDPARTANVPDVMLGIVEVLRLVTDPGDIVVVSAPVYPPFFAFVEHDGRRVVQSSLDSGGRIDLGSLEQAFASARAKGSRVAYLMSNPHNPTGVVHTRAKLEAIAQLAHKHRVRVVSDEIHAPLVLPGAQFTAYLSVDGADDAFAVASASKAWNLAGLKAALIVAGSEAAGDLARLPEEVSHGPSHLANIAHTAALREGGAWLDSLINGLAANRELLGRYI